MQQAMSMRMYHMYTNLDLSIQFQYPMANNNIQDQCQCEYPTSTSISDINTHSQFANLISISDTNINVLTFALAKPFEEGDWTCHFKSKDQI